MSLTASYFKDLFVKISADMNKWDNETCQYLEELQYLMGQHFPHTQCMSWNPVCVKRSAQCKTDHWMLT